LTFHLLTSGSLHAEILSWTTCLPTLVLITQAVFLLERGQTDKQIDKQTDAIERLTHAGGYTAGVGKYASSCTRQNCDIAYHTIAR